MAFPGFFFDPNPENFLPLPPPYPEAKLNPPWAGHYRRQGMPPGGSDLPPDPPFGSFADHEYSLDPTGRWIPSDERVLLPIQGAPNWNEMYLDMEHLGEDLLLTGTRKDPLHPKQRAALDAIPIEVGDFVIISFQGMVDRTERPYDVYRVQCVQRLPDNLEDPNDPMRWSEQFVAACKIYRLTQEDYADIFSGEEVAEKVDNLLREYHVLRRIQNSRLIRMLAMISLPDSVTHFPYSTILLLMEDWHSNLQEIRELLDPNTIPEVTTRKWMQDIFQAVHFLHRQNIAHLDIKPENLVFKWPIPGTVLDQASLDQYWQTMVFKLGDFSESRIFASEEEAAEFSEAAGTLTFRPPEMFSVEYKSVNAKACDIYSLGLTLASTVMNIADFEMEVENEFVQAYMGEVFMGEREGPSKGIAWLIYSMIEGNPALRPTIDQVLRDDWSRGVSSKRSRWEAGLRLPRGQKRQRQRSLSERFESLRLDDD